MKTNNEIIKLAEDYTTTNNLKPQASHHLQTVINGYVEGYKQGVIDESYRFIEFINSLDRKLGMKVLNKYVTYSDDTKKNKTSTCGCK